MCEQNIVDSFSLVIKMHHTLAWNALANAIRPTQIATAIAICNIFTVYNKVAKVMFLHLSVILFTGGVPGEGTPPPGNNSDCPSCMKFKSNKVACWLKWCRLLIIYKNLLLHNFLSLTVLHLLFLWIGQCCFVTFVNFWVWKRFFVVVYRFLKFNKTDKTIFFMVTFHRIRYKNYTYGPFKIEVGFVKNTGSLSFH